MQQTSYLSSFSRRKSRGFRERQKQLIEEVLPKYSINIAEEDFFARKLILEIGFGGGEHLIECAQSMLDYTFIGCEPFLNGVAQILGKIVKLEIKNILLWPNDARPILEKLPGSCLDGGYILFPDPWPKKRHNRRRLVNSFTLALLHSKLKEGSSLIIATDHQDYARHIREIFDESSGWQVEHSLVQDIRGAKNLGIYTRYATKALNNGSNIDYFKAIPLK